MASIKTTPEAMNMRSDVEDLSNIYSYLLNIDTNKKPTVLSETVLNLDLSELVF